MNIAPSTPLLSVMASAAGTIAHPGWAQDFSVGVIRFGSMGHHWLWAPHIHEMAREVLAEDVEVRTDGWCTYRVLNNDQRTHEHVVGGDGVNADKALPWVHTLIANTKSNNCGVYHGVSNKHLDRYLAEFYYRFNRRFWEFQMVDRALAACSAIYTVFLFGAKGISVFYFSPAQQSFFRKNELTGHIRSLLKSLTQIMQ